jgi:hypothetical protein
MKTLKYVTLGIFAFTALILLIVMLSPDDTQQNVNEQSQTVSIEDEPEINHIQVMLQKELDKLNGLNDPENFTAAGDFIRYIDMIENTVIVASPFTIDDDEDGMLAQKIIDQAKSMLDFDKLRPMYCNVLRQNLWEVDIDVVCQKNSLKLVSHKFILNSNIKQHSDVLNVQLGKLRYKHVDYTAYKERGEYTRFTFDLK